MAPEKRTKAVEIKAHAKYEIRPSNERLDEKLMQSAALFLLKVSRAAESIIVTDTKH